MGQVEPVPQKSVKGKNQFYNEHRANQRPEKKC